MVYCDVDVCIDVYLLGVVFYEFLVGVCFFNVLSIGVLVLVLCSWYCDFNWMEEVV